MEEKQPENKPAIPVQAHKQITDNVLARVMQLQASGELKLPKDYSPENALNTAFLVLQGVENKAGEKALVKCTRESVANSLLDMVIQGLSPAKKQCYFVMYGNKLELMRSYMGTVAIAKRVAGVADVNAQTIYEGDEFVYEIVPETGIKRVVKHIQKLEDINPDPAKIKGAYAIILFEDGRSKTEIMNIKQIRAAWNMGASNGGSPAHKNFGDEMAEKTVTTRALKIEINSSSDSSLYEDKAEETQERVDARVHNEIEQKGNLKTIGFSESAPLEEGIIIPEKKEEQPIMAAKAEEPKAEAGGTLFAEKKNPGF